MIHSGEFLSDSRMWLSNTVIWFSFQFSFKWWQ